MNQVVIVGRVVDIPETKEERFIKITIAVQRSFKNVDGVYETDFVECKLFDGIAMNSIEYLNKGDIVGVKGRLQSYNFEEKNIMEVIAEKITFLSSRKGNK